MTEFVNSIFHIEKIVIKMNRIAIQREKKQNLRVML